jgi:flavin-dependent dehydrogenase
VAENLNESGELAADVVVVGFGGAGAVAALRTAALGGSAIVIEKQQRNAQLGLPNYARNWLRHGFDEADLHNVGSDRFIDAILVSGGAARIADRIREHLGAGADHVAVQVLRDEPRAFPVNVLRALAAALGPELRAAAEQGPSELAR